MVGVFVADHFHDPADDHVFDLRVGARDRFDLGAGEGHLLVEGLVVDIAELDELIEPFSA